MTPEVELRARWIVLTPTPHRKAWVSAITHAAMATGLECYPDDISAATANAGNSKAIIITDDAALAMASDAQTITSILTDYADFDGFDPSYVPTPTAMSTALAQACSNPGITRVIGVDEVRTSPQALSVFDDVTITPPRCASTLSTDRAGNPITAMFGIYRSGPPTPANQPSHWAATVFNLDERATRCGDGRAKFDITGRPRFLVSGPYIALTAGRWLAKVRFSVDLDACKRPFRFDWGTQEQWCEHSFVPGRPGIFDVELRYDWDRPEPCEMRIVLQEGCFAGEFIFYGVQVSVE